MSLSQMHAVTQDQALAGSEDRQEAKAGGHRSGGEEEDAGGAIAGEEGLEAAGADAGAAEVDADDTDQREGSGDRPRHVGGGRGYGQAGEVGGQGAAAGQGGAHGVSTGISPTLPLDSSVDSLFRECGLEDDISLSMVPAAFTHRYKIRRRLESPSPSPRD